MVKYKAVANDLRKRVLSGEFDSSVPMPIERDLCTEYNVSKETMKKSLVILVNEGLIYRQSGRGTFVYANAGLRNTNHLDNSLEGFSGQRDHDGNTVDTKVLMFEVVNPPEEVAKTLHIKPEQFVYHYQRIRSLNGENEVIEESFVPIDVISGLNEKVIAKSFFEHVESTLKLKIKSAHKTIVVSKADAEITKILNVELNDPVPVTYEVIFLSTGAPFVYSIIKYNYQNFNFVTTVTK